MEGVRGAVTCVSLILVAHRERWHKDMRPGSTHLGQDGQCSVCAQMTRLARGLRCSPGWEREGRHRAYAREGRGLLRVVGENYNIVLPDGGTRSQLCPELRSLPAIAPAPAALEDIWIERIRQRLRQDISSCGKRAGGGGTRTDTS